MKYISIALVLAFLTACGGEKQNHSEDATVAADTLTMVDSLAFFEKQIKNNPYSTDWLYQRAVYLLGQGDLQGSEIDLEKAMRIDSNNLDVQLLYANIKMSVTDLATGKYHYEYILNQDSINTGALMGLSKLNALIDNFAEANIYISRALKIDPNLAEAYFMRGIIHRAYFYQSQEQSYWDIALSSFQTAVEQDPNYYSAYVEMGVMHDQIGSDLALEYYNSALEVFPESIEAWYNIGMFYQTRGEINEAQDAYRKLNKIDSTWADPYYNQGYIHLVATENLDSAIFFLTKATECDPDYYQAYNNLGLAYELKGDISNAKKYYGKAIEANPDFQLAKDNLNNLQ